ncbi:dihydrofolate reductase family protein [Streptoalloteichus hindustanus]|uniref:Dihydrofolate reductase n=1 Tax=Streptoalloteichus hindustanus TaxID=2017 RepID=A0A1M5I211_STRHI|nr:dihydrofolate reductase family protein [Streptoalloteichus hindustanus]SHG22346.1 Dihydrofolate reductase [Streptoalloteichus hindustanus]
MGRIIHFVHQSLDGYIEGPRGEFDWPVMDSEIAAYSRELSTTADTFLYGRIVWGFMSNYWPRAEQLSDHPHDLEFAPIWRAKPKAVVSRTLQDAPFDARVFRDVESLARAKADESGTFLLFGGSELASSLTRHGLIDEYHIFVHPVLLGGGKPVFADVADRAALRLVESRVFDNQAVLLRHERVDAR